MPCEYYLYTFPHGFGQCLLKLNVYSPANKNSAGMLREHTFKRLHNNILTNSYPLKDSMVCVRKQKSKMRKLQ